MTHEQRRVIDAELRAFSLPAGDLAAQREGYARFMATMATPAEAETREQSLGGLRTLVVEAPRPDERGTILFFHGGSWMMGSPETELCLTAALVVRTGFRAYSPEYRLAPEHPFPAGIDDCLTVYRALIDGGVDPSRLVVAGDSAGGGLAMTTLIQARRHGLPLPAGYVGFSAGLDATRSGASMTAKAGIDPIFTREALVASGELVRAGADPEQELLSPAVFADVHGFPPMLLQVGTNELLLDDSIRMADRAREAGVDVILDVTADVPHVFQAYAGRLTEADDALDRAALFIRQRVGAGVGR